MDANLARAHPRAPASASRTWLVAVSDRAADRRRQCAGVARAPADDRLAGCGVYCRDTAVDQLCRRHLIRHDDRGWLSGFYRARQGGLIPPRTHKIFLGLVAGPGALVLALVRSLARPLSTHLR